MTHQYPGGSVCGSRRRCRDEARAIAANLAASSALPVQSPPPLMSGRHSDVMSATLQHFDLVAVRILHEEEAG